MFAKIRLKSANTSQWEDASAVPQSGPNKEYVLADAEPALEKSDDGTIKMKVGDGVSTWEELPYISEGSSTPITPIGDSKIISKIGQVLPDEWTSSGQNYLTQDIIFNFTSEEVSKLSHDTSFIVDLHISDPTNISQVLAIERQWSKVFFTEIDSIQKLPDNQTECKIKLYMYETEELNLDDSFLIYVTFLGV